MSHSLSDLVARADGGQFALAVVSPSAVVVGTHPDQYRWPTEALTPSALTAISWTARYRTKTVRSKLLVVPTSAATYATQLVLDEAWALLDSFDEHLGTLSRPFGGP